MMIVFDSNNTCTNNINNNGITPSPPIKSFPYKCP